MTRPSLGKPFICVSLGKIPKENETLHHASFYQSNGQYWPLQGLRHALDKDAVFYLPPIPAQPATTGASHRGSHRAGLAHARLIRGPGAATLPCACKGHAAAARSRAGWAHVRAASPVPRVRLSHARAGPRWVAVLVRTARVCLCARGRQSSPQSASIPSAAAPIGRRGRQASSLQRGRPIAAQSTRREARVAASLAPLGQTPIIRGVITHVEPQRLP